MLESRWYALDGLRSSMRSPGAWVLAGLGVLGGWGALELSILALGAQAARVPEVVASTGSTFAVLVALHVLARTLDDDRTSRLRVAADCTAPGPASRLAGRWGGAVATGALAGIVVQSALVALAGPEHAGMLLPLYSTMFSAVLVAGAWGLLIAVAWPRGPVVLLGLLIWFVGHLPWGTPMLLGGTAGHAVSAVLPGPDTAGALARHVLSALAASIGLVLIALAWGARPQART